MSESWLHPLTPDQRRLAYYKQMAGSFPGPTRAAIAAMIAFRMVELEGKGKATNERPHSAQ